MDPLFALLMLAANRRPAAPPPAALPPPQPPRRRAPPRRAAPRWPTPASPPPVPAFSTVSPPAPPVPSADQGGTSTPLAELHARPPVVPPPRTAAPAPRRGGGLFSSLTKTARGALPGLVRRAPNIVPGVLQSTQTVARLQSILINRGYGLAADGLYGPKTAGAWTALAKAKGLPSMITRVGPQTARVATQTYEVLSIPAIP